MEYTINNGSNTNQAISRLVKLARHHINDVWAIADTFEEAYDIGVENGRILSARDTLANLGIDWKEKNIQIKETPEVKMPGWKQDDSGFWWTRS